MRRGPWHALSCWLALAGGCAQYTHGPAPGPAPAPAPPLRPWARTSGLRTRVPPGDGPEVVLDDRDGLSPQEAGILAVDRNPRLRAVRAERGIARAALIEAGVLPNPQLGGSIDPVWYGPEAAVMGYGIGLSWNVTPLLSRGARVGAAEAGQVAIDLEVAWQEWQVAQAARLHALRCIYLTRRVEIARELEDTWRGRLEALQQARAAGAVGALEVANAERSRAEARVMRLQLEQRLVVERAGLNRAIGIEPTREIALDLRPSTHDAAEVTEAAEAAGLLDELPRRRLDLVALQHAQRSQDGALRAAVLARFPPLQVGIQTRREVDQNASVGMTLSFELPFFDRNQAEVARARARRTQVAAEYEARLFETRAELQQTLRELRIVGEQRTAAHEAADAAGRLAALSRDAAAGGALTPLAAAAVLEQAFTSRLRALEIEQAFSELRVALALISGRNLQL